MKPENKRDKNHRPPPVPLVRCCTFLSPKILSSLLRSLCLCASVVNLLAAAPQTPQISPALSEKLAPLHAALDAKNTTAALAQIDALLPATRADTYDHFLLLQIQAQLHLSQNAWTASIPPLETLLAHDAAHTTRAPNDAPWLTPATRRDIHHTLAQLHYTQAADLPLSTPPADRRAAWQRTLDHARQAAADPALLTPDIQTFLATALYAAATADPAAPDPALLRETLAAAQHGLALTLDPRPQYYLLLIAAHQQLGNHTPAAETLELLVQHTPDNKTYWSQLAGTWLNVAEAAATHEPDRPAAARSARLRAIHAVERGQQHGAFDTPRDRQNLINLYLNLDSPEHAIPLLETGLRDNLLPPDPAHTRRNYELLVAAYQKTNDTPAALAACTAAAAKFPADGNLDLQASQLYHQAGRPKDALAAVRTALTKGNLDQPSPAHLWHAWLALEQSLPEEASAALDRAAALPAAPSAEIARLREALAATPKTKN